MASAHLDELLASVQPPSSLMRLVAFASDFAKSSPDTGPLSQILARLQLSQVTANRLFAFPSLALCAQLAHFLSRSNVDHRDMRDFAVWLVNWNQKRIELSYLTLSLPGAAEAQAAAQARWSPSQTEVTNRVAVISNRIPEPETPERKHSRGSAAIGDEITPETSTAIRKVDATVRGEEPRGARPNRETKETPQDRKRIPVERDTLGDHLARANRPLLVTSASSASYMIGASSGAGDSPMLIHNIVQAEPFIPTMMGAPEGVTRSSPIREQQPSSPAAAGPRFPAEPLQAAPPLPGVAPKPSQDPIKTAPPSLNYQAITAPAHLPDAAISVSPGQVVRPHSSSLAGSQDATPSPDSDTSQEPQPLTKKDLASAFLRPLLAGLVGSAFAGSVASMLPGPLLPFLIPSISLLPFPIASLDLPEPKPGGNFDSTSPAGSYAHDHHGGPSLKSSPLGLANPTGAAITDDRGTKGPMQLASMAFEDRIRKVMASGPVSGTEIGPSISDNQPSSQRSRKQDSLTARAELGQVTLLAPPMKVASERSEQAGTGISFSWRQMAEGISALDESGLSRIQSILPPGSQLIYPALPITSLGPHAVNLPLSARLTSRVLTDVGVENAGPLAAQSNLLARRRKIAPMGSPLEGMIVPVKAPISRNVDLLGNENVVATGALGEAGQGQATRGSTLGFLGMPVRVSPSLAGNAQTSTQIAARKQLDEVAAKHMVRPADFAIIKDHVLGGFPSVSAEVDAKEWKKAAPAFGLQRTDPASLLAPEALAASSLTPKEPDAVAQSRALARTPLLSRLPTLLASEPPLAKPLHFGSTEPGPESYRPIAETLGRSRTEPAEPPIPFSDPATPSIPKIGSYNGASPRLSTSLLSSTPPAGQTLLPTPGKPLESGMTVPRVLSMDGSNPGVGIHVGRSVGALPQIEFEAPISSVSGPLRPRFSEAHQIGKALADRAPDRLMAPQSALTMTNSQMIQKSTSPVVRRAEPDMRQPGVTRETKQSQSPKDRTSEINSMAAEVWSLLKSRLAAESVRKGRY